VKNENEGKRKVRVSKGEIMEEKVERLIGVYRRGVPRQRRLLCLQVVLAAVVTAAMVLVCASDGRSALSGREDTTIVDEWASIKSPPAPKLAEVTVEVSETALLVLDIQNGNCNPSRRPRCVASLGKIQGLLSRARANGMAVVYSLTRSASASEVRKELSPIAGEPIVKSGVDKFFGTELEKILRDRGIRVVILVGTSAHGAVLHTATGAALRGLKVLVPVDGMSASERYAEQYTAWHLVNGPGSRRATTLTKMSLIRFK